MEKYSAFDKTIYIGWILLLFLGVVTAGHNVLTALTDPTYASYRSFKHILLTSAAAALFVYLFYALASGFWRGQLNIDMLIRASKLGDLLSLFSVITMVMILFFKIRAVSEDYYVILLGILLGGFGFYTRKRFKKLAKKNPAME
ncbi:MAG TPA: hypothetical protein VGD90_06220 [Sphingobacteriaceae bacterium]